MSITSKYQAYRRVRKRICLGMITLFHLAFGLSAYFQTGLYTVDIWMIDGRPGTGNTPIEKLLALIFSLWYLGSIIPVIWSYFNGSPQKLKIAISGPFLYHLFVSYNFFFHVGNFDVCNPKLTTPSLVAAFHGMLAIVCVASIDKKSLYTYNRYVEWRQNKIKR